MISQSRFVLCLCLAAAALALPACTSLTAITTEYVGAPHPPPTDPSKVQILRVEPTRASDRLGEIAVDASVDPAPPMADIENKLRTEGAKLGADAVVVVVDRVQPVAAFVTGPWWGRSIDTVSGQKVVGVAIRYR